VAKRVTIIDVAREVGVDSSTVSLALRNDPRIKFSTRERIHTAAKKIGYLPNQLAKALSGGKTRAIGVMLTEMNRYFGAPLEEYQAIGEKAGYTLSVHFSWWDMERERHGIKRFCENCVEGVIWAPDAFDERLLETAQVLQGARIPTVVVGLLAESSHVPCHQIGSNMHASLRLGLNYLIRNGHRNIAIATAARMEGMRGAMHRMRLQALRLEFSKLGLALSEENVFTTDDYEQGGIDVAVALTQRPRSRWPTAIFAVEDMVARSLSKSLHALGVSVPRDISLLGFDVVPSTLESEMTLTTISNSTGDVARQTINLLLRLIRKTVPNEPYQRIIVPYQIIENGSCRPLTGGRRRK
jgi:LacI family transcriptional regulator